MAACSLREGKSPVAREASRLLGFGMMTLRTRASTVLAAVICLSGAPGFSQPKPAKSPESEIASAQVRRFLGMAVENRNGAKLGVIKDFVVDFHTGRINYAILSSAGILGLRAQLTAVPVAALSTATVKQRTLALDISKVRWNDAPRFHKKDLQLLCERTQEVQLFQFYGLPVSAREAPARPRGQLQFATALMAAKIIGPEERIIGTVSGLLLDLTEQRPAMAVVTVGESAVKKQTYAVPVRLLAPTASDKFKLDATPAMFQQAPMLTPKIWQSAAGSGNAVYRCE